ncbi:ran protein binding protein [Moniliophthora roreri MCA 2997]|uniref:Ran protein binding protein n=1 Tax=Moniliophthora roreri (strain MCA 2997) TaxID=1381753 RepID=V2WTJ0_MONRO|nr:ran protein binding protein [Moniliophthora roreri MCA 2997]
MTSNGPATVIPSEVGWQFVPQYYAYINKEPERLHCFYSKQSVFVHGTEGEEAETCHGQQEIHTQITNLAFDDCKIFIHSVDAQSSANGGIIIQVIGEMSNSGGPWRKFVQTFFLAEQPNGYFVLNDIFRFLKEDAVEGDESVEATSETEAPPAPVSEPVAAPAAPAPVDPPREPTPPPEVDATAVPVEEPPTSVSDITEPAPPPVSEPPAVPQPNGVHHEAERPATPAAAPPAAPAPIEKSGSPAPAPTPSTSAPTPPPQTASASTSQSQQPAAAPAQPAAAPAPQPAAAPVPKTWANLAAANSKKWGSAVAQESRGTTEVVPSAPASGSQTPQAPNTPVSAAAAAGRQGGRSPHPAYQAAQSVTIPQCFIKNVTENITESALRAALVKFGSVKQAEIVRHKACAFAEFTSVDAAKRAIVASLPPSAGGEGGVKVDVGGGEFVKIIVETKKERGDRPVSSRGRGGATFGESRGGGGGGSSGGDRGSFRGRGGSGRGRGTGPK